MVYLNKFVNKMSCRITLKINQAGTQREIYIGESPNPVKSFADIKKLLNKLTAEELDVIMEALPNIEEIDDINIADISENSVGVFTPAELISSMPQAYASTLYKLKLDKETFQKNIIISGFGPSDVRTQYFNGHIFLNLNYLYNEDNKALAVFEAALYLSDIKNYDKNVAILSNPNIDSEAKISIISSAFRNGSNENDYNLIKSIYDFSAIKKGSDYIPEDLINKRDSVYSFITKFTQDTFVTNREINYGPRENIRVEALKQGDLVLVNFKEAGIVNKTKYEVFYDYFIDKDGNIVLKTYSTGSTINNRLLKDTKVTARKYVPETINNFSKRTAGINVPVKERLSYLKYKYIYNLIKEHGVAVDGIKIKSMQGSIITLEDGQTKNIQDIKTLTTDIKNKSFNSYKDIGNAPNAIKVKDVLKSIPVNSKILMQTTDKEGNTVFREGLVLAKGTRENNNIDELTYITSDNNNNNIVAKTLATNVEYLIPNDEHIVTPTEAKNIGTIISNTYLHNNYSEFLTNKDRRLENLEYSVEKINKATSFSAGDIIYDFASDKYFKVIEINNKAIILGGIFVNKIQYLDLKRENLKNALLFTKTPVNVTFGINQIIKNRYKIDNEKDLGREDIESIELKGVFQKKNGFVYGLIEGEEEIYSEGDKNITTQYREFLAMRFNKTVGSQDKLYAYKYNSSKAKNHLVEEDILDDRITKSTLHERNNTRYFNINKRNLKEFIEFIVPGSFITFNNNAKAFIVEKVLENKLLLAAYHYSNNEVRKNAEGLEYVISERFLLDLDNLSGEGPKPVALFVPNWAENNIKEIEKKLVSIKGSENKAFKASSYSAKDSPEIIAAIGNFISDKYGVKVNYISAENFKDFPEINMDTTSAFVQNGEIFINIDKASIEEPLHELLHLVLMTLKSKDPDKYYLLVNSVQNHPAFNRIAKIYSEDINTEKLEEAFIKMLTATFRRNIVTKGIFDTDVFNEAINGAISELLDLTLSLENEDSFELLDTSIEELMTLFGSQLLGAEEGLIDNNSVVQMLQYSGIIKQLINNGNLKEACR